MTLTSVKIIGIHRGRDQADFKLWITKINIDETILSDEKWKSLFLTQIDNGDLLNGVKNVRILHF